MHAHMIDKEYDPNGKVADTYQSVYYPAPETDEQSFRDQMLSVLMADAPDTGTLEFRPDRLELTTARRGLTTVTVVTLCDKEGC